MHAKKLCMHCGELCHTTQHHVIPRRLEVPREERTIDLCTKCHAKLELQIKKMEFHILRQFLGAYVIIARQFVGNKNCPL